VASAPEQSDAPDLVVEPAQGADIVDTSEAGPAAIRGGPLRAGAYALGIVLSLVSAPLLIRHLGVTGYGQFVTVSSLLFIVVGITDGGRSSIQRMVSSEEASASGMPSTDILGSRGRGHGDPDRAK
jgi:hypothetical protein